jgi:hypothetical protein
VDTATRWFAAVGLACAFVATVYTVTSADWIKAAISAGGAVICLLWGLWPNIRRTKLRSGVVSFEASVDRAEFRQEILFLVVLVSVHNDTDIAVTVRPTDLVLIRRKKPISADILPHMGFDPMGRMADFSCFPEGQYTTPARSEESYYFFFRAKPSNAEEDFSSSSDLQLRLTVCLPGPHRVLISLPSIVRHQGPMASATLPHSTASE